MSDKFWVSSVEIRGGVYPEDVAAFKNRVQKGDRLICYIGIPTEKKPEGRVEEQHRCTVKQKYTHHALTTKGSFQWTMLTIWNRQFAK